MAGGSHSTDSHSDSELAEAGAPLIRTWRRSGACGVVPVPMSTPKPSPLMGEGWGGGVESIKGDAFAESPHLPNPSPSRGGVTPPLDGEGLGRCGLSANASPLIDSTPPPHPSPIKGEGFGVDIGTGTTPQAPERRQVRINGAPASANSLSEWLSVLWLPPAMDRLFADAAAARRRFLDRLVLALRPDHAGHAARYEAAMRARN